MTKQRFKNYFVIFILTIGYFAAVGMCEEVVKGIDDRAEVIIYGGTPAGVMAAIAAAKHQHHVALVDIEITNGATDRQVAIDGVR